MIDKFIAFLEQNGWTVDKNEKRDDFLRRIMSGEIVL